MTLMPSVAVPVPKNYSANRTVLLLLILSLACLKMVLTTCKSLPNDISVFRLLFEGVGS